ncbi:hypothetical protein AVEN_142535-1 [Araneus ventricosus]|uniref:Gustatory receptor n=1 Tax=Araneus ventricosus TaxID=182803 RepID=A0A4Y2CFQ5_ARAVE|nr:hypothetical protein AVEN_142535-1 [Araneus ventricosus]
MQTLSCPHPYRKRKIYNWAWKSPKYVYNFMLILSVMLQILWIVLMSNTRREITSLIFVLIQISAHISVFRSRHCITSLLKRISDIFKPLNSIHRWKRLKTGILIYCICGCIIAPVLVVTYYNTKMRTNGHKNLRNSPYITEHFKELCVSILDVWYALNVFAQYVTCVPFIGYYCFVCVYMKHLLLEFVSKSQILITRRDYQTIIEVYQEITQTISFADNFLSYPAFVNVLCSMVGLFWASYSLLFFLSEDSVSSVYLFGVLILYSILLLIIMLPASAVNKAVDLAKNTLNSLPGWFPDRYETLKLIVLKKFKQQQPCLTLWKVYRIDKPLLVSTLGTLVTYGFLVGTLGTVRSSRSNAAVYPNIANGSLNVCH